MGDDVDFFIPGVPVPQGSKTVAKAGKKVWLRDANASRLKPWRETVAKHADLGYQFVGPVMVRLYFRFPRPKRPKFEVPAVKPDIDKLERAVYDGLTDAGLIEDDSRIVKSYAEKSYHEEPGVRVIVRSVENV